MVSGVFSIPFDTRDAAFRLRKGNRLPPLLREYIAGDENLLVRQLFRNLAEQRNESFNPIVLCGVSGTGKSMLARGLAAAWAEGRKKARILVMPAIDFARDYANAVETDAVADFRAKLRRPAVLIFDDLHQIAERHGAQSELTRILDRALSSDQLVIVTASHSPIETLGLAAGLSSRLAGGLVVPIAPPGTDAKRVILQKLGQRSETALPDAVIERIIGTTAESGVQVATVQQLNNVVQRLVTTAEVEGRDIDDELTRECLTGASPSLEPQLGAIAREVAKYFGLRVSEIRGPKRQQRVVRARGVAMLIARRITANSLDQIGKHFGGRDHTTVMHACRKTESLSENDAAIRLALETLTSRLAAP